jgi:hypothetical protein
VVAGGLAQVQDSYSVNRFERSRGSSGRTCMPRFYARPLSGDKAASPLTSPRRSADHGAKGSGPRHIACERRGKHRRKRRGHARRRSPHLPPRVWAALHRLRITRVRGASEGAEPGAPARPPFAAPGGFRKNG